MPRTPEQSGDHRPNKHLRTGLRTLGAAGAATLALIAADRVDQAAARSENYPVAPLAHASAPAAGYELNKNMGASSSDSLPSVASTETNHRKRLLKLSELPGYNKNKLTTRIRAELESSTAQLMSRPKNSDPSVAWEPVCTTVRRNFGGAVGSDYFTTAAHCIAGTGSRLGVYATLEGSKAYDYVNWQWNWNEYAIAPQTRLKSTIGTQPVALVDSITIKSAGNDNALGNDAALLHVTPVNDAYNNITALSHISDRKRHGLESKLKPGEAVALYGIAQANQAIPGDPNTGFTPNRGTGIWLGTMPMWYDNGTPAYPDDDATQFVDIIGIIDEQEARNVGSYGYSGGSFKAQNGLYGGIAHTRVNWRDDAPVLDLSVYPELPSDEQDTRKLIGTWQDWQRQLGISFKPFRAIVTYSHPQDNLWRDLLNARGHAPTLATFYKDGEIHK